MKIIINPKYAELEGFVNAIPDEFENGGEIIYDARNQIRVFSLKNGLKINVKRYAQPTFLVRTAIYSFFHKPKAVRAYAYALKLLEKKIATPEPVAYVLIYRGSLLSESYLITLQLPLKRNFYEFGYGDFTGRKDIVKDFAAFAADLHDKQVYHKDFSPGNILFDEVDGKTQFAVVDINRMSFGNVGLKKGCKNFQRLWGKADFFHFLAYEYAKNRQFDAELCDKLILKYRHQFWRKRKPTYEYE